MALNRDQILAARDFETREVECPEWGGSVRIRALTAREVAAYRRSLSKIVQDKNVKTGKVDTNVTMDLDGFQVAAVRLVALAAIDDAGAKLFNVDADLEVLAQRSFKAIDRIAEAVIEISGMKNDAPEEAEKN